MRAGCASPPRMSASPHCVTRPQAIIDACRLLGFQHLFMPAVPPEQRDADAAFWRSLGRELGALSQRFADAGIQLGYHNHNWELQPKDGSTTALELLFAEAEGHAAHLAGRRRLAGAWRRGTGDVAAALQ